MKPIMWESMIREIFENWIHIGRKLSPSLRELHLTSPVTAEELKKLLDSYEYIVWKSRNPSTAMFIENILKPRKNMVLK